LGRGAAGNLGWCVKSVSSWESKLEKGGEGIVSLADKKTGSIKCIKGRAVDDPEHFYVGEPKEKGLQGIEERRKKKAVDADEFRGELMGSRGLC